MDPYMDYEDFCTFNNTPALVGWTRDEKLILLHAIRIIGSTRKNVHENIPTKTPEQVQLAITYYKRIAMRHPNTAEKRRRNRRNVVNIPRIPLTSWAQFLTKSYALEDLQTEIPTALRLIADFECIPSPASTDNIDFRKMYRIIANAAEGKPMQNDRYLGRVIDKALMDTALVSKSFIQNSYLTFLLQNIDTTDQPINVFTRPSSNNELATVQHLVLKRNYNPLNIPDQYLKASKS